MIWRQKYRQCFSTHRSAMRHCVREYYVHVIACGGITSSVQLYIRFDPSFTSAATVASRWPLRVVLVRILTGGVITAFIFAADLVGGGPIV